MFQYFIFIIFFWSLSSIEAFLNASLSEYVSYRVIQDLRVFRHDESADRPINRTEARIYMVDILNKMYPEGRQELRNPKTLRILNNGDQKPLNRAIGVNLSWYPTDCSTFGYKFTPIKSIVDDRDTKVWVVMEENTHELYIWKRYKLYSHYSVEIAFFSVADHHRLGKPLCTLMERASAARIPSPGVILEIIVGMPSEKYFYQLKNMTERASEVARIGAQVYDALKYMHWLGYTHGDVKPSNVIIGRDGNAMLIDFGFTLPMPYYKIGQGTPNTISPEVTGYLPGPMIDNADWYSFGQLLLQWQIRSEPQQSDYCQSKLWSYKYELTDVPNHYVPADLRQLVFYLSNINANQRIFATRRQQQWLESLPFWKEQSFAEMHRSWDPVDHR